MRNGPGPLHRKDQSSSLGNEKTFEEVLFKVEWAEVPRWEYLYVHNKLGLFLSFCVDDIKMVGKSQNPQVYVEESEGGN